MKLIISTSGCTDSWLPTPAPSPFTRLKTPAGTPASSSTSAKTIDDKGAISEGFSTQVSPASSAGITFSVTWFIGQFQGVIRPTTPTGSHATMLVGACAPKGRTNWNSLKALMKLRVCQAPASAWSAKDMSSGAPISRLIARAMSGMRRS